ncbi:MAG: amidohydrolase family protein [Gammaproteobacteria bacterium]
MSTEIDLLIHADYLYPMSEGLPVYSDAEVAVRADRIVYAGPKQAPGSWQPRQTLSGHGKAVLPGFVNAHSHAASLIFRSQTDDFTAGQALYTIAFRLEKDITPEEWQDLALLGCADMLTSGITTINDIWYNPDGLARAVKDSGLRAVIANKIFDVRMEELYRGDYTRYPAIGEQRLRDGVAFVERWHQHSDAEGRIHGRMATHASDTCSRELHQTARAEADRLQVGMHSHTAQSAREVDYIQHQHGCGPLEYLRDIGLLRSDVVVAHLTYASDADLAAVRETNAGYAHCPIIYPRRGVYPRLQHIESLGIRTGFATDWMQNDPFEGMRNAINAVRLQQGNADLLPCQQALWYYTQGSAEILGLGHEIGSLEAGKKADMIVLDIDQAHLQPFYGPIRRWCSMPKPAM